MVGMWHRIVINGRNGALLATNPTWFGSLYAELMIFQNLLGADIQINQNGVINETN